MPALSRASVAESLAISRKAPRGAQSFASNAPAKSWLRLWPLLWKEALRTGVSRCVEYCASWIRGTWAYRLTLGAPVRDRIVFSPDDPRPKRLDDADGFFRNRFRFGAETIDAKDGSIFDCVPPSAEYARALHGFEWLLHLEAAGGEGARKLALKLTSDWLARHARYTRDAWRPEVTATRFLNLLAHGRFFLTNSDLLWRSRLFVSLKNQARILARTLDQAPDGLPRLEAAAALSLAGLCLDDTRNTQLGLTALAKEIERQILPDGGHVSRSPETLNEAYRVLWMVQQALDAANRETQVALRGALDRMAPMLRFFRMGDGALGVFNGGGENDTRTVTALLVHDQTQGRPFGHAPHSGFQRLAAGRTLVLFDIAPPPPASFSCEAHAGCLSFEMSAGAQRIIVNCGAQAGHGEQWEALRATAAHSTLTLADSSSAMILPQGLLRRLLGPRMIDGAAHVETRRSETAQGLLVEASHDAYGPRFGIVHQRRLVLSPKGGTLTGGDRLLPIRKRSRHEAGGTPFAIRFHIHPDVRLSLAQGGASVILKLPGGEGWRFRCGGGALSLEESIYLGGGPVRRTEQLVISGVVKDEPVECAWLFEQAGAGG